MEFILPHLDSNSFSGNKELFEEIATHDWIVVQVAIICVNTWEYFTLAKLDEENGQSINLDVGL
jgi:hypothetical protein